MASRVDSNGTFFRDGDTSAGQSFSHSSPPYTYRSNRDKKQLCSPAFRRRANVVAFTSPVICFITRRTSCLDACFLFWSSWP
ncbi:hypothetical protein T11_13636 [Trichinella zimbabwensis]|uniref:Uncharacterized protein n=1 Tax=Trichinella zimbabwensis TaxID=268475 RepID=A0A0V1HT15_9BILA|nr:hypothetical protein T11_13636 [Trichinella zimbabwensis]